ncbi:class I SAM-dependent methyltransferase [Opitutia bacterium ISCC 51]|nr:class I SAM-dependent methyltransferase [Opitutae bacterium ISCC 51]QXD27011.1 class I SAM-dependent methyltransferase [Opitutae bacterium ISCC 52]
MDYSASYNKFFKKLKKNKGSKNKVYSDAVGGDYEEMGYIQMQLLKMIGIQPDQRIVDVGCGSGRLAHQLAKNGFSDYTGFDVVPDLLSFAKSQCSKSSFKFKKIEDTHIPLPENSVDLVCFFSVFTHLFHEDSYKYLISAKSILKETGKIAFSFLTFDEDEHWALFDRMVEYEKPTHHNQFMTNSQIEIWADKLGFKIDRLETGSTPFIPLEKEIILESGAHFRDLGSLGQGVCVLSKA